MTVVGRRSADWLCVLLKRFAAVSARQCDKQGPDAHFGLSLNARAGRNWPTRDRDICAAGRVGRFKRWFITRLDLAIVWLLEEHVTDAYRFLMRYYQEGDRIFVFGFSRGAYLARAVAAMVYKFADPGQRGTHPFAWDIFKRERDPKLF